MNNKIWAFELSLKNKISLFIPFVCDGDSGKGELMG